MKIAQASEASGISVDTLRFYEKEGLITPARSSGHRVYSAVDLDELDTIARLRRLGISIPKIRSLLEIDRSIGDLSALTPEASERVRQVQALVDHRISGLESQISELQTLLATFQTMSSKLTNLLDFGGLGDESR